MIRKLAFKLVGREYSPDARIPHGAAAKLAQALNMSRGAACNLLAGRKPGKQTEALLKLLYKIHRITEE